MSATAASWYPLPPVGAAAEAIVSCPCRLGTLSRGRALSTAALARWAGEKRVSLSHRYSELTPMGPLLVR